MNKKRLLTFIVAFAVVFSFSFTLLSLTPSVAQDVPPNVPVEPENISHSVRFYNQDILDGNSDVVDQLKELGVDSESISELQTQLQNIVNRDSASGIAAKTMRETIHASIGRLVKMLSPLLASSLKPLNCWPGKDGYALISSGSAGTVISKFSMSAGSPNPLLMSDYCDDGLGCTYFVNAHPGVSWIIVYSNEAEAPVLLYHDARCQS